MRLISGLKFLTIINFLIIKFLKIINILVKININLDGNIIVQAYLF